MKRRHHPDDWRASGAFRVGLACQAGGRYDDAVEAYERVLTHKRFAEHLPTLHNLAVSQIRSQAYDAALDTLDALDAVLASHPRRDRDGHARIRAQYDRALAQRYLERGPEAIATLRTLLVDLLGRRADEDVATHFECPALTLLARLQLDVVGTGERERAADVVADATPDAPARRKELRESIRGDAPSVPLILASVRSQARRDARAHYNLLCLCYHLAELVPSRNDALLDAAAGYAERAFRDRRLAIWAQSDPALNLDSLRQRERWAALLERYERSTKPAPATEVAP